MLLETNLIEHLANTDEIQMFFPQGILFNYHNFDMSWLRQIITAD